MHSLLQQSAEATAQLYVLDAFPTEGQPVLIIGFQTK
jgi:hypothetical protein